MNSRLQYHLYPQSSTNSILVENIDNIDSQKSWYDNTLKKKSDLDPQQLIHQMVRKNAAETDAHAAEDLDRKKST
jgi:hypothetical protein